MIEWLQRTFTVGGAFRPAALRAIRYGNGILVGHRAPARAAPSNLCLAGASWPQKPAATRERYR